MKPWDLILAKFNIQVTTMVKEGTELIYMIDPQRVTVPQGFYLFNEPILNEDNKKRELIKVKIRIANRIINKVFQ